MLNPQTSEATELPAPGKFGARILDLVRQLAQFSELPEGLTCTYFSPAHKAAAAQLYEWMRSAGLAAEIDPVGNVVGRYRSDSPAAKTLIVGSHYDTVANAGQFDGRLGILTALVVAEHLQRTGQRLPFNLDIIAFSEEEGVRFSAPYLGSGAIAGCFDESALARRDANDISLATVLRKEGVDLGTIQALARAPDTLCGYLEVHIEQGPVLLQRGSPVGIVSSITGSTRFRVTIEGLAGHAGTVPMSLRRDAAAAAAEIVLAVERRCSSAPNLVGTVGQLAVPHGLINVIPGTCEFSLDIRSADDATRNSAIADLRAEIEQVARRRRVTAVVKELSRHHAVPCAPRMQSVLAQAAATAGVEPFYLPSGAGHDAEMFAGVTDIGMLFVRCGNGGISHSPLETVTVEDTDLAARILLDVLLRLN
ncbi:MAG TPA: allantoate amidohydrolase [Xanthobacteraceae bacterium]|nr:allantoate amidohydrolase [Xanthobacteraceae bacterium]